MAHGVVGAIARIVGAGLVLLSTSAAAQRMLTSGQASVSSGAATYSVPIQVPPGVAGVAPQLAFVYNSQAGNGPLGIGWNLSGLSAITRCPRTRAQDNAVGAIAFNLDDHYCLDGQRLIVRPGFAYGANGAEYRTEIESFSRIIGYGSSTGHNGVPAGPTWFKVWTKAGEIIEYGNTPDSRIEARSIGAVRVWAMNRLSDTKFNYQDFSYSEDTINGDYNILRVRYTGNNGPLISANPLSEIRFQYEPRTDIQDLRQGGVTINSSVRLKTVETWSSTAAKVREYRLGYSPPVPARPSQVATIQECADNGVAGIVCLPPLRMAWRNHAEVLNTAAEAAINAHGGFHNQPEKIRVGDFNGDGRLDLVLGPTDQGRWNVMLSTGTGLDPGATPWATGKYGDFHDDPGRIHVVDFNGDGLSDIVIGPTSGGTWSVLRSTGSAFVDDGDRGINLYGGYYDSPERIHPAEIDGDGLPDFIIGPSTAGTWHAIRSNGINFVDVPGWTKSTTYGSFHDDPTKVRIMDLNGDGLSDVTIGPDSAGNWFVLRSTGATFIDDGPWIQNAYGNWDSTNGQKRIRVSDVNGDGLADIVIGPEATGAGGSTGNWYVLRSNGRRFENAGNWLTGAHGGWAANSDRIRNLDLNGDGQSDVLLGPKGPDTAGEWFVLLSQGNIFHNDAYWARAFGSWYQDEDRIREMDLTGDGLPDIVIGPTEQGTWHQLRNSAPGNLIDSITDDFGMSVTFNYKSLTDSAVYTKDAGNPYPIVNLQTAMWVVSSMASSNGVGGTLTTSYRYGGLKSDVPGRGSLGFRWIEETDAARNITVRSEFSQAWPTIGMPTRTVTTRPGSGSGGVLSDTAHTLRCLDPENGGPCTFAQGQRYFPYISDSTAASWDLNGTAFPINFSNFVYDRFGNATRVWVYSNDGFTKETLNTYTNDASSKWHLGRLTRTTVASTSGGSNLTRTSAFTYDPDSGLLNKEIVEPDSSDLCLATAYTHDAFGNRSLSTTRNCNGSAGESGPPSGAAVFSARTSRIFYDSRGQFPTSASNALSQTETTVYEARQGNPTSQTGPNGIATSWAYDAFGRRTLETRADGTRMKWEYLYCSGYHGGTVWCPQNGSSFATRYLVQETPLAADGVTQNGPWRKTYYDPLGRVGRVETQGFDGTVIFSDTWYDSLGHMQWTMRPIYGSQTAQWSYYAYDVLDRPDYEGHPGSSGFTYTFYGYSGLQRTVTHPLNQIETRTTNSQGWLVSSRDAASQILSYQYDPYGNLIRTTDPAGNVNTFVYDLRGRKMAMTDRDMGSWSYVYNAAGELIRQTDAQSYVTTMDYDLLGRMTRRVELSMTADWTYDRYADGSLCSKGIGKLCEATASGSAAFSGGYRRRHVYDSLGRPSSTTTTLNPDATTSVSYDTQGRVATQTYPTGFAVKYIYTGLGYLREVRDNASNALYWRADTVNAEGQVTQQTYGNNLGTTQVFEPTTGRLKQILAGSGNSVQNLSYNYDNLGRVLDRSDSNQSLTESFGYDNLNRLTSATVNSPASGFAAVKYGYDGIGNLTSRSDLGTLIYPPSGASSTRPHAVSQFDYTAGGRREYRYDGNGNVDGETAYDSAGQAIPERGRSAVYYDFNKPIHINSYSHQTYFSYDSEHQRHYQQTTIGSTVQQLYFLHPDSSNGLLYEKEIHLPGFILHEHRHYITAGGVVVALVKQNPSQGTTTAQYLHRDHLGSVTAITDASGNVVERLAYDSFGKRRQPNGQTDPNNLLTSAQTDRGYTNHQHLDHFDLINTNGRIYDPTLGRFLGADPYVQMPSALQSHNRYSYAFNNPVAFTDPSGYFLGIGGSIKGELRRWERDFRREIRRPNSLLGPVVQIAGASLGLACGPGAPGCVAGFAAASTAFVARAQGVTGSALVRASAISAATAYAFNQVGSITSPGSAGNIALHGLVGGLSSVASTGDLQDFASGFVASSFASAVPLTDNNPFADVVIAATVAGTTSEITGGKFANAAVTGAFGYLFNQCLHEGCGGFSDFVSPEPITPIPEEFIGPYSQLEQLAMQASGEISRLIPQPLRGIFVHKAFADRVRGLQVVGYSFAAEQSYIGRFPIRYGSFGSVRADAIYGSVLSPTFIVDVKTGGAYITRRQFRRYRENLPVGTPVIQIKVP